MPRFQTSGIFLRAQLGIHLVAKSVFFSPRIRQCRKILHTVRVGFQVVHSSGGTQSKAQRPEWIARICAVMVRMNALCFPASQSMYRFPDYRPASVRDFKVFDIQPFHPSQCARRITSVAWSSRYRCVPYKQHMIAELNGTCGIGRPRCPLEESPSDSGPCGSHARLLPREPRDVDQKSERYPQNSRNSSTTRPVLWKCFPATSQPAAHDWPVRRHCLCPEETAARGRS